MLQTCTRIITTKTETETIFTENSTLK